MYEYEEGEDVPKSSFVTYLSEGNKLYMLGEYAKALESYTTALEMEPTNVTALVARSRCFLHIGDAQAALLDAQSSLDENKTFHRGLYQKAEALYQMGDFEYALVFYHRGHKLRPELQEFRLGIQKAQEAIDNCVGSPSSVKLENRGDLSFFNKMDEGKGKVKSRSQYRVPMKSITGATKASRTTKSTKTDTSDRTAKALLGELYADKEYLEKLLKDDDLVKGSAGGMSIFDLVTSGINYLDTRTEFWRQQKPMYARKRDRGLMRQKWSHKQKARLSDPTAYILMHLEKIDRYLAAGRSAESLALALATLKTVNEMSEKRLPNKIDVIANLYSCIGNAYLELGRCDEALKYHAMDLEVARQYKLRDARSRALDNLGRVYARMGSFQKAIDCWEKKLPMSKSALEKTWLFHEIGRCYLELDACEKAKEYGQKSLEQAKIAEDEVWHLNASVLIAQTEVKLKDYVAAVKAFKMCLELAKLQGDEAAEIAITKALQDIKMQLKELTAAGSKGDKVAEVAITAALEDITDEMEGGSNDVAEVAIKTALEDIKIEMESGSEDSEKDPDEVAVISIREALEDIKNEMESGSEGSTEGSEEAADSSTGEPARNIKTEKEGEIGYTGNVDKLDSLSKSAISVAPEDVRDEMRSEDTGDDEVAKNKLEEIRDDRIDRSDEHASEAARIALTKALENIKAQMEGVDSDEEDVAAPKQEGMYY